MATCATLAADNIQFLEQALALVGRLPDGVYARSDPALFRSGVGPHLRHCLDHYTNFLAGLPSGRVDYDARARDPRLEREREAALARMRDLVAALRDLQTSDGERRLLVKMDCGEADGWAESTVRRELQFLISHTVHHYALIALILRLQGIETGPGFGVAPSTLRYQASGTCAR
jgi:uncharacterized damage-inducible protein DinB